MTRRQKNLDMKDLRLSSMVLVDNQFSSLNVWGLDPDSYKTTILKQGDSDSDYASARSETKTQAADDASITRKQEDTGVEGSASPMAGSTKRTYAEAAGSSQKSAGVEGDVRSDPDDANNTQRQHPGGPKDGEQEDDEHSSYATATGAAETHEEAARNAAPARGDGENVEETEKEATRRDAEDSGGTSTVNLAGMVRDKEEVDRANNAGRGQDNLDARSWKTSKGAAEQTRVLKQLHIDHPDDKKRFDKYGNSRAPSDLSTSGVSSNAKSTATINRDDTLVRYRTSINTLQKEKLTLEADKAELERKAEDVARQQLLDMIKFAREGGFDTDQIEAFAAMQNLSLDGTVPRKNVNFDGDVKDSNKATSRQRSKVGTLKDVDKTSRGPATISAEKEKASTATSTRIGESSLSRAARGVRLDEKLSSTGTASTGSTTKRKDPSSIKRRRSTKSQVPARQAKDHQEEAPAKPRSISTPYSGPSLDDDGAGSWTEVTGRRRRRASDRDSSSKPARILRVSSSSKAGDGKTPSTSKRRSGSSRAGTPSRRGKAGGTPRSS